MSAKKKAEKPVPTNPKLYEEVKKKILKAYGKPSAYASGAIVKEYKQRGGKYKGDRDKAKLTRWFNEEWINVNPLIGVDNDDAYPLFRPTKRINDKTPTTLDEIPLSELKKKFKLKQIIKGKSNLPKFESKGASPLKPRMGGKPHKEDLKPRMGGKTHKKGGGLKSDTFRKLLDSSYEGGDVAGFIMDKQLSTSTSKVYKHPSGQVVVAHRGTSGAMDWGNNLVYGLTGDVGYKLTSRYREAKKVQQNAEKKYGAKNITTIGHSQGGLQAQLLGGNTREIITLNKATRPQEVLYGSSKKENQYDVRASGDVVSAFRNPFQTEETTIKSKENPLAQHSIDILESEKDEIVGDKTFYGNGIRRKGDAPITLFGKGSRKKKPIIVRSFSNRIENRGVE